MEGKDLDLVGRKRMLFRDKTIIDQSPPQPPDQDRQQGLQQP